MSRIKIDKNNVISDTGSDEDWNFGWGEKVLETSINRVIEAIANNG